MAEGEVGLRRPAFGDRADQLARLDDLLVVVAEADPRIGWNAAWPGWSGAI
jgi:hypothetical protein